MERIAEKKKYITPEVIFVQFDYSERIAASCDSATYQLAVTMAQNAREAGINQMTDEQISAYAGTVAGMQ